VEACGAPGGAARWISDMVAAAGLEPRDHVARELAEVAHEIATGLNMEWAPPESEIHAIPTRLARVRYRFLASFYEEPREVVYEYGPPDDPGLRGLWQRARRAQDDVARLKRRLARVEKKATEAWVAFATAEMAARNPELALAAAAPAKRGAKGNVHHREPVRALVRLYRDVFGAEPRRSNNGPVMRFVTAFFGGLEGDWYWLDAERFEPSQMHERARKHNEKLAPVRRPSALRDIVRHALEAESEGEPSALWEDGPALFAGYFVRHRRGEADLPLAPPKNRKSAVANPARRRDI
jgi:hypothetical protein